MQIRLVTVGKLREPHLTQALEAYEKRLRPLCDLQCIALPAQRLSDKPSRKEIDRALAAEAQSIRKAAWGYLIAMCIEGKSCTSEALSQLLTRELPQQYSAVTFVIGSSFGLDPVLKQEAQRRLSMSPMTFPHALACVMLLEQIYRCYQIDRGTGYHK